MDAVTTSDEETRAKREREQREDRKTEDPARIDALVLLVLVARFEPGQALVVVGQR